MSSGNEWYQVARENLISKRGGKCQTCGSTDRLEFAHLRPTGLNGMGRGFNRRVLDVLRHPRSYRLLCRSCHDAFDGRGHA